MRMYHHAYLLLLFEPAFGVTLLPLLFVQFKGVLWSLSKHLAVGVDRSLEWFGFYLAGFKLYWGIAASGFGFRNCKIGVFFAINLDHSFRNVLIPILFYLVYSLYF